MTLSMRNFDARGWAANFGILALLGLLTSPPLANLAELLLLGAVLANADLRASLRATWRYPLVKFVAAFFAVLLVGSVYSMASVGEVRHSLLGWLHRLVLVPFALAVFERPEDKERLVRVFGGAAVLFAVVSFGLWLANMGLSEGNEPGIMLRNHSTQGMGFAVGVMVAAQLAFAATTQKARALWAAGCALLILNIAFVTTGRSGYLVLMVCGAVFFASKFLLAGRKVSLGLVAGGLGALALIGALLAAAPSSRERLALGVNEVQAAAEAKDTEYTSMGIRIVFWKNTLDLIRERPLLGYGTGSFAAAYKTRIVGQTGFRATETGDPHNQYLKFVTENGVVALVVFLGFVAAALLMPVAMPWRMLGAGVLLSWCATSLFNAHFSTFAEGHFVYLWLGFMLALPREPASA